MISVNEAKHIISENIIRLAPVERLLEHAVGLVLAENIESNIDVPAFDQSAMDGYAFSFYDWKEHQQLKITGNIPAGSSKALTIMPGEAMRIFTGAPLPMGADTVVMQEKVTIVANELMILDEQIVQGRNKRNKGSEIKAGSLALPEGSLLTPAAIGYLAGIGTAKVRVYPKPMVSIIVTGKELQTPGNTLGYGEVYESNSFALRAALQQLNFNNIKVYHVDDDLELLSNILMEVLKESNLVLLTGGISVGDYDFVLQAANACGVEKIFHKIKQKPGKPLYFGKKGEIPVFGLPGNPASVLTCFYQYVVVALYALCNQTNPIKVTDATLAKPISKPTGLAHFLKAEFDGKQVTPCDAQESYKMSSFARANCLIELDENTPECREGELVKVHLLPV